MGVIFFYDNKWDGVSDVVPWTEHQNFPAELTQHRDFNHPWQSENGAGSAWGKFVITSSNNKLYFKDNGGTARIATLTAANYQATTLAIEIETQMEATPTTDTFTVEYLESGSDANKFKITDDVGTFELTCTIVTSAVWPTIGYLSGIDKTGAAYYVADYIRIHSGEFIKVDLGAATSILAFIARGHNIQSGAASKKIQGNATDSWASPSVNQALSQDTKLIGKIFSSAESYRWWRGYFEDIDNPDGYIWLGRIFLGPGFEPTRNYLSKSRIGERVDQSIIKRSQGGQISTVQFDDYESWQYIFKITASADVTAFETMFETVKRSKPLWICEDSSNFPSKTYYCQFVGWEWIPISEPDNWWELRIQVEELT